MEKSGKLEDTEVEMAREKDLSYCIHPPLQVEWARVSAVVEEH